MTLGADPKEKAPDGTGSLLLAAGSRQIEAVKLLVELGADVNEAPKGKSALHTATRLGANDVIQYLVEHGADLTVRDVFGRTPLEEAEFEAPKPTIELLRKLSAEAAQHPKQ
jgi:ankyrin repeat protein